MRPATVPTLRFRQLREQKTDRFNSTCHQIGRNRVYEVLFSLDNKHILFGAMCEEPCRCVIQHRYVIRLNKMTDRERALPMRVQKGVIKHVGHTFFSLHRRPARATSVTWHSPLFFASALNQIARRTTLASDIHLHNMATNDVLYNVRKPKEWFHSMLSHKFGQACPGALCTVRWSHYKAEWNLNLI